MVFAFAYPLVGGTLCSLLIGQARPGQARPAGALMWRSGVAALTVGSLMRGALEIYGTSHPLTAVYVLVGSALCAVGAIQFVFDVLRVSRYNESSEPSQQGGKTNEDHYHQP